MPCEEIEIPCNIRYLTIPLAQSHYYTYDLKKPLLLNPKTLNWKCLNSEKLLKNQESESFKITEEWIHKSVDEKYIDQVNDKNSLRLLIGHYKHGHAVYDLVLRLSESKKLFVSINTRNKKSGNFHRNKREDWKTVDSCKPFEFLKEDYWIRNFVSNSRCHEETKIRAWNIRLGLQSENPKLQKCNSKNVVEIDPNLVQRITGENEQVPSANRKYSSKVKSANNKLFTHSFHDIKPDIDDILGTPEIKNYFQKSIQIDDLANAILQIPEIIKEVYPDYETLLKDPETYDLVVGAISSRLYSNLGWNLKSPKEIQNCSITGVKGDIDQVTLTVRDFVGSDLIQKEMQNVQKSRRSFIFDFKEEEDLKAVGIDTWKANNDLSADIGFFGGMHRYHNHIRDKVCMFKSIRFFFHLYSRFLVGNQVLFYTR